MPPCRSTSVLRKVARTFSTAEITIDPSSPSSIAYSKKKDKQAQITFKKDESVRKDDVYKSSAVSVPSGEAANSVSWPPAERKAVAPRPVASGKLLRPGGPSQTANVRCSHVDWRVFTDTTPHPPTEAQARRSPHAPIAASPFVWRLLLDSRRTRRDGVHTSCGPYGSWCRSHSAPSSVEGGRRSSTTA